MNGPDPMNEFEQRLRRVPLQPAPPDWRAEILAVAVPVRPAVPPRPWSARLRVQWPALLWPAPRAWAGLATVWLVILVLQFASRDPAAAPAASLVAQKAAPPTLEMQAELRQQQQLLVELLGPRDSRAADRPHPVRSSTHTRRAEIVFA